MESSVQSNIDAFNNAFAEYVKWTRKTPQGALEQKLKGIGFRLFKGFQAHEFGGVPRQAGIAKAQLQARTAEGLGTKVRPSLIAEYKGQRDALQAERNTLRDKLRHFGGTLDDWSEATAALKTNKAKRVSLWQAIVGKEISLRKGGIGYLATAFLWYRTRSEGENQRSVKNRSGGAIGSVSVSDGLAVILGSVDGLTRVDAKYGVVSQAISGETDDTLAWIKKQQDAANAALTNALLS